MSPVFKSFYFFLFVFSSFFSFSGFGQASLPKVFLLGEHESAYEQAMIQYQTLMLQACDNNMEAAHQKWVSMLTEMEAYSRQIDFDLRGLKIWIHVFWNRYGGIDHLAYFLKPQSKNLNTDELTAFFKSFSNHYQFPLLHHQPYSHYGAASFPVYPQRIGNDR